MCASARCAAGEIGMSCHGMLENYPGISAEYRALTKTLFNKYFPMERDPHMTEAEKIPHMVDWCVAAAAAAAIAAFSRLSQLAS